MANRAINNRQKVTYRQQSPPQPVPPSRKEKDARKRKWGGPPVPVPDKQPSR